MAKGKRKAAKQRKIKLTAEKKKKLYGSSLKDRMKPDIKDKDGNVIKKGYEKGEITKLSHSDQDAISAFMDNPGERPSSKGYRARQWEKGRSLYNSMNLGSFEGGPAPSAQEKRRRGKIGDLQRRNQEQFVAEGNVGPVNPKDASIFEKGQRYWIDSQGNLQSEKKGRGLSADGRTRRDQRLATERANLIARGGIPGAWAKLHGSVLPSAKDMIRERISGQPGQNVLKWHDPRFHRDAISAQQFGQSPGMVAIGPPPPRDPGPPASGAFGGITGSTIGPGSSQIAQERIQNDPALFDVSLQDPGRIAPDVTTPNIDALFGPSLGQETNELLGRSPAGGSMWLDNELSTMPRGPLESGMNVPPQSVEDRYLDSRREYMDRYTGDRDLFTVPQGDRGKDLRRRLPTPSPAKPGSLQYQEEQRRFPQQSQYWEGGEPNFLRRGAAELQSALTGTPANVIHNNEVGMWAAPIEAMDSAEDWLKTNIGRPAERFMSGAGRLKDMSTEDRRNWWNQTMPASMSTEAHNNWWNQTMPASMSVEAMQQPALPWLKERIKGFF